MDFYFRKRTKEVVYVRYGVSIEAETYEEALQLIKETQDWKPEKESTEEVLDEKHYYIGTDEKPIEEQIIDMD